MIQDLLTPQQVADLLQINTDVRRTWRKARLLLRIRGVVA